MITVDVVMMAGILAAGTVSDLRDYKVRNPIIVLGWLLGLVHRYDQGGTDNVGDGVFCIMAVILILWPFYLLHVIGAGDVKMLSVVGGFYGMVFLGRTTVIFLLLAGAASLWSLLRKRLFLNRFHRLLYFILYERRGRYYEESRDGREAVIPLTPVLSVAFFTAYLLEMG